jgi:hypothetical protein
VLDVSLFSFKKTPNAAIYLNNLVHVREKSAGECAKICLSKSWCRSFDYYKAEKGCDLSDVGGSNIDGSEVLLKTDYWRNPYDFYDIKPGYGGDMVNLALRANVGASSNNDLSVNTVDGVDSTTWISAGTLNFNRTECTTEEPECGLAPQTITIDLGEKCLIRYAPSASCHIQTSSIVMCLTPALVPPLTHTQLDASEVGFSCLCLLLLLRVQRHR